MRAWSIGVALCALLVGCPSKTEPAASDPAPADADADGDGAAAAADGDTDPAGAPQARPPRPAPKPKIPRTDPEGTKEAQAWDALKVRVGDWVRLLPGQVKDPESRAALEAPFTGDAGAIERLALLTRYLPMEDPKVGRVLNIVGLVRREVTRNQSLDPGLFDPKGSRATVWIGLMDPVVVQRARLLKTPQGWTSPEDVSRGAFDLGHARALRECLTLAHAGDWSKAIPRYQDALSAIAAANSEANGAASVEAWRAVETAQAGDLVALEEALDVWWRTFVPKK